jgi:hypothetical protein
MLNLTKTYRSLAGLSLKKEIGDRVGGPVRILAMRQMADTREGSKVERLDGSLIMAMRPACEAR